jgi:MFS family permease
MRWKPLAALGAAQFLSVLDTSVMNVSISQLVADFHTTVTAIQPVITVYTLVMAAFTITGERTLMLLSRIGSWLCAPQPGMPAAGTH